jgi:SAM-dependent methyltransferase
MTARHVVFINNHPNDCVICKSTAMQPFARFSNVPISGHFCRTIQEKVPERDLVFDYCPQCAFVSQRLSNISINYSNVARSTARQIPGYTKKIIGDLIANSSSGLLVEVGCNDGTFLNLLRQEGFFRLLGVEPSRKLAAQVRQQGHEVFSSLLEEESSREIVRKYGKAQSVVCRHTLEHVPHPLDFLRAVRLLLDKGGLLMLEVPSLRPIIDQMHVHEMWDEHVSYFLPDNLVSLLIKAGFLIERVSVKPHLKMENIVVLARAGVDCSTELPNMRREVKACRDFSTRWQNVRLQMLELVRGSPRPLVFMGASHPQSNLLNFSGISPWVDCAIDDDPSKAGLWLPLQGSKVPIWPMAKLKEAVTGGTLLLTGFGYPRWMKEASEVAKGHAAATLDILNLLSAP